MAIEGADLFHCILSPPLTGPIRSMRNRPFLYIFGIYPHFSKFLSCALICYRLIKPLTSDRAIHLQNRPMFQNSLPLQTQTPMTAFHTQQYHTDYQQLARENQFCLFIFSFLLIFSQKQKRFWLLGDIVLRRLDC